MPLPDLRGSVYRRYETDDEFWARAFPQATYRPAYGGAELDDFAWTWHRKQRRLVEVAR